MGFRAPAVAGYLFGASLAIAGWAFLGAGALGLQGPIGLEGHRRGLLVLAAGVFLLPLARITHAELDVPCVVSAAVLLRIGRVRWDGIGEPGRHVAGAVGPPVAVGAATPATSGMAAAAPRAAPGLARVAGRWSGRAGTVLGREAESALPRAARAAGRAVGRARNQPPRR